MENSKVTGNAIHTKRVETIEAVCNFVDGGENLDLSTRLTKLETWVADGGIWDETCNYLSHYPLVEWQFGGKDEMSHPELHDGKVALRRWTFHIRAIEDRLDIPRHQLICSAWIYSQLLQRSTALEDLCGMASGKGKLGFVSAAYGTRRAPKPVRYFNPPPTSIPRR